MLQGLQRAGTRFVTIVLTLLLVGGTGRADEVIDTELTNLNQQILRDPQNIELNLRYAKLAEQKGDLRKALSAYERVTVNSPSNQEAQDGFRRVTRKLQPDTTTLVAELGAGWESNPARECCARTPDALALARVEVKDERSFGEVHWRTIGNAQGEFYRALGNDLNYGFAGVLTGPMSDLTSQIALHTGLGVSVASFSQHKLYDEAIGGLTLETGFWKGAQSTRLRVGYRRYGEFFGGSEGFYADLSSRLGFLDVLQPKDAFVVTPSFRWSGISGIALNVPMEETQPGHYRELGLRGEYYMPVTDWLTFGTTMSVSYRNYIDITILETGEPVLRRDWLISPGASLIFPNIFKKSIDWRLDYKYEDNRSNVAFDGYRDHQITTSTVFRF
jgi:hypothetical protein